MSEIPNRCHICERPAIFDLMNDRMYHVYCQSCGEHVLSSRAGSIIADIEEKHLLAGVVRNASERGEPLRITTDNASELIRLAPNTILKKAEHLLHLLARKTPFPSEFVKLNYSLDYSLVYGRNENEIAYFVRHLREKGYLKLQAHARGPRGRIEECSLTVEGWARVEADRRSNTESEKAFVAMWFNANTYEAWTQGIKQGIIDAGYKALRIDILEHNDVITDKIIAEIRESRFIVADFTGNRGGVYYEAGFAKGLGLTVISTVRKDHLDGLHFDTRQISHIVWENPAELRERLAIRIRATVGRGPLKREP